MRISEVAEITGLSVSNIRFYEKKGLVGPARDSESKYRNYTDDDVKIIKEIVLYRKMDLSVEMISGILKGEISLQNALNIQLETLIEKQQILQGSIDLCKKMSNDGVDSNFDVDEYLGYVKEAENAGQKFASVDDFLWDLTYKTKLDKLIYGGKYSYILFEHPWIIRVMIAVWCLFIIGAPVVCIILSFMTSASNAFEVGAMAVWLGYIFWLLFSNFRDRC